MSNAQTLRDNLTNLNARDQEFASSLLNSLARYGSISPKQAYWVDVLAERATAQVVGHAVNVGNVQPIIELFELAGRKLKWPKIRLFTETEQKVVLKRGGDASKYRGQILVTDGGPYGNNIWFGRIDTDGTFYPNSRLRQENRLLADQVVTLLQSFAEDPAGVGSIIGKRTGHCVFCSRELSDARSTTVGYGPICAGHYGLPWGEEIDEPWVEENLDDERAFDQEQGFDANQHSEEPF